MASQTNKRDQFGHPKPNIIAKHTTIPRMGTRGTHGVLNWRGISGLVFRRIITPAHTNIKANRVPILVISPTISPGTNAAKLPTKTKKMRLDL